MKNVVTVVLEDKNNVLYQWDRGQRFILTNVPTGTHVDFIQNDEVLYMTTYGEDNTVYVDIPDILLQTASSIKMFVYISDANYGETIFDKHFTVLPRKKPTDYTYTPPEKPATTSISWNDLEDKPFYDTREIIPGVNIEWDGDTTGKVMDEKGLFYKVSDLTFTDEEVKEMTVTTTYGTFELKDADIYSMVVGDGCYVPSYSLYIVRAVNSIDGASETTYPEIGVYFGENTRSLTSEDTISENGELKQIDEKFIPKIDMDIDLDIYEEEEILFSGDANFTDPVFGIMVAYAKIQLAPYDLEEGDNITILNTPRGDFSGTLESGNNGTILSLQNFTYFPETGMASVPGDYSKVTQKITIKRTKAVIPRLKFATMPKSEIVQMVLSTLTSAEEVEV